MEPEGSLPRSQNTTHSLYYESNSHRKNYFLNIHFNIILTSTPRSSERSLLLNLFNQTFVCMRATCTAHSFLIHLITLKYYVLSWNVNIVSK